jgi:protein-arginine kinase activator protein McsA
MELGTVRTETGVEQPRYTRKSHLSCWACGVRFKRVAKERLCAPCFVARNRPVFS